MLLSGALLALFITGFWLYCLTDAILTPASDCRGLTKPTWLAVIIVTFIVGALAWLIVRQPARDAVRPFTPVSPSDPDRLDDEDYFRSPRRTDPGDAVARHPAARARATGSAAAPMGPDDDPEFLRALGRAIKGNWQAGGEAW
jgi:peptidoglycan/LPS O-acetylase OafA/YrhL